MKLSIVLCFLALHVVLPTSSRVGIHYEEGYEVTTDYSSNQAGIGVHLHSIYTDLQNSTGYVVVDSSNSTILTITLPLSSGSELIALAGSGVPGYEDGAAASAQFSHPQNAVVDDVGNVYVGDTRNGAIRKVAGGRVTTIAGGSKIGFVDGLGWAALFSTDIELHLDKHICALKVVDRGNNAIRSIRLDPGCCRKPPGHSGDDLPGGSLWDVRWLVGASVVSCVLGMVLKTWLIRAVQATSCGIKELVLALMAWCHLVLGSLGGLCARVRGLTSRQADYPNLIDV